MEKFSQFYARLREYNQRHFPLAEHWPEWCSIYQASHPPAYWLRLSEIVSQFPLTSYCLEIGSGLGDVLALMMFMGFTKIKGLEKEPVLADAANKKILDLFGIQDSVISAEYPQDIKPCPDLLIQVNCVYQQNVRSKDQYLDQLSLWHTWNGVPTAYIVEVIDSSFTQQHSQYPLFVRLSSKDVQSRFKGFKIKSFPTYKYPANSSSKRLYCIVPSKR